MRTADLLDDIEWLVDAGESAAMIAARTGKTAAAIAKACERACRRDLARMFWCEAARASHPRVHRRALIGGAVS